MTALLHVEGRRVVLVFTDGMDSPMPSSEQRDVREVGRRAEQEDVMVYAIGLAGQTSFGHSGGRGPAAGRWRVMAAGDTAAADTAAAVTADSTAAADRWIDPIRGSRSWPRRAAAATSSSTSTNDLASTFSRVADELHHQYVLGFEPEKLDGKMHRLEVRLKQTGMTPRARHSYVAAKPEARQSSLSPAPPDRDASHATDLTG